MITFLISLGTATIAGILVSVLYKKEKIEDLSKRNSELINMYNEAVSRLNFLRSAYDSKCAEVIEMKRGVPCGNNS